MERTSTLISIEGIGAMGRHGANAGVDDVSAEVTLEFERAHEPDGAH